MDMERPTPTPQNSFGRAVGRDAHMGMMIPALATHLEQITEEGHSIRLYPGQEGAHQSKRRSPK